MKDRIEQLHKGAALSTFDNLRQSFRMSQRSVMKSTRIAQFLRKADGVRTNIRELKELIEKVKRTHSNLLTAVIDQQRYREDLYHLQTEIRDIEKTVRAVLHDINPSFKDDMETCSSAELRIRKMQFDSLTQEFVNALQEYQSEQATYNDKCKDQIKRRVQIVKPELEIDDDEVNRMIESAEQSSIFTGDILISIRDAQATLSDLKQREKDMIELEKKVVVLNELFKDMNMLVAEQSEIVTRIEDNVTNAEEHVIMATENLRRASEVQSRWRKKKIILVVVIVVVIILIISIVLGSVL